MTIDIFDYEPHPRTFDIDSEATVEKLADMVRRLRSATNKAAIQELQEDIERWAYEWDRETRRRMLSGSDYCPPLPRASGMDIVHSIWEDDT